MSSVGIRNLKNKLSSYLKKVKEGQVLRVTERGRTIAYITPAMANKEYEEIKSLVEKGMGSWKGGKPKGSDLPVKISGKSISQIVAEDRR